MDYIWAFLWEGTFSIFTSHVASVWTNLLSMIYLSCESRNNLSDLCKIRNPQKNGSCKVSNCEQSCHKMYCIKSSLDPNTLYITKIIWHILLVDNYLILSLKSTRELSKCRPKKIVHRFNQCLWTKRRIDTKGVKTIQKLI